MNLKNKIIVITGGTKGLGKDLAINFLEMGAKVIICSHSKEELKKFENKHGVIGIKCDVTKEEEVINLAKQVIDKYGKIDIWINNAGIWLPHGPIEKLDTKRVHDLIEVNLFGMIYGSREALIQMRKQQSGIIVNILTTSALEGRSGSSGYCASKYAAKGFSKSLRLEVMDDNIKVLNIYPGRIKTSLFDEAKPENYDLFMETSHVSNKIINNLLLDNPEEELVIKRENA